MDLYNAIIECLGYSPHSNENITSRTAANNRRLTIFIPAIEVQTAEIVYSAILSAEKLGKDLDARVQDIVRESRLVHTNGLWYEGLAVSLLEHFRNLIEDGKASKLTGAAKEAFDKAKDIVQEFVHDHPVLTAVAVTLLVLALLMYAAPWAIEALGFTLDGPLEGSYAAAWQSELGDVEAASWFAFWQRLGMTWGK
ncbi:hypothetical protein BP6252_13228 [Coleophoma cylindrospora]|uniref:Uncharacterized protein n=1 Tax=Coleophoma cylindrospora TaxID=1849047 RepID=A0A3D8QA77_9HELO|nr:hypothetical protein BP6252_13228 [Coleophoma cylindrospora]